MYYIADQRLITYYEVLQQHAPNLSVYAYLCFKDFL